MLLEYDLETQNHGYTTGGVISKTTSMTFETRSCYQHDQPILLRTETYSLDGRHTTLTQMKGDISIVFVTGLLFTELSFKIVLRLVRDYTKQWSVLS